MAQKKTKFIIILAQYYQILVTSDHTGHDTHVYISWQFTMIHAILNTGHDTHDTHDTCHDTGHDTHDTGHGIMALLPWYMP